ncbi:MAG: hypothetical protein JJT89_15270 [Nitriliruptoraceae bacterium]|nr:hypothetical protein [Nitriliruptoraceae bacterium]
MMPTMHRAATGRPRTPRRRAATHAVRPHHPQQRRARPQGRSVGGSGLLGSTVPLGRTALLGLVALVVTACGGGDPEAASSRAPSVPVLDVVVTDDVATLVANVVDPGGELQMVTIEWGDGTSDTVTSGFPGVRVDHTYTDDGEFTIVLEARSASGQQAIATTAASITAFAAAAVAEADAADGDAGRTGSGSRGSGGSVGGSTRPPAAPAPAPAPAPEPEPESVPDPVTVELLDDDISIDLEASTADNAGGSAEAVEQDPHGFGLRSYAWHGYGGSGEATGTLTRRIDAASVLADMPDHVTAVYAEVSYVLEARAELKGPHDRTNTFEVTVADLLIPDARTTLTEMSGGNDSSNPTQRADPAVHTGTLTAVLPRDHPTTTFRVDATCTSNSGDQALALLNEGYCDALDQGGIRLNALSVTFTPLVDD